MTTGKQQLGRRKETFFGPGQARRAGGTFFLVFFLPPPRNLSSCFFQDPSPKTLEIFLDNGLRATHEGQTTTQLNTEKMFSHSASALVVERERKRGRGRDGTSRSQLKIY